MEKTTQVFLGVRMVCAQCHDHPFERWTQNQYYQMAAFFSAVGMRAGLRSRRGDRLRSARRLRDEASQGRTRHEAAVHARLRAPLPVPTVRSGATPWRTGSPRRTIRSLPRRSPTGCGAISSGKGIIDPVDDIRASNPPSNPALLDALTKDFVGARVRFALPDAHHRQLPGVSGVAS